MATLKTKILSRNDTKANWEQYNPVLGKGEIGLEIDTGLFKFGNGVSTWNEITKYANDIPVIDLTEVTNTYQEVASFDALQDGQAVGDVGIVKAEISEGIYSHTCYIWNGEGWAAADGNYDASNVYFNKDLTLTKTFGKYTPDETTGSVKVESKGMTLEGLILDAYSEETNPTATDPAVSFTTSPSGTVEVGTVVTPKYAATLSAGSYTYGPETGITATGWEVTNNVNDTKLTAASGQFDAFTVTDGMSGYFKVTATATHGAGSVPVTNLGNDYEDAQIEGGTKSKQAGGYTGYRAWFHGYKNGDSKVDINTIDSTFIRGLTSKNGSWTSSIATTKMQQMFFAAPAGLVTKVEVKHSVNGAPQTVLTKTVYVKGAGGYVTDDEPNGMAYDLFYVSNDNANSGSETYNVTVTKA